MKHHLRDTTYSILWIKEKERGRKMSIYDEAKQKSNELTFPYNMFFDEFIERAKKVEELLGLYRKYLKYVNVDDIRYMQIANKIEQKEEELK